MKEQNSNIKYQSEFNIALLFIPIFPAAIFIFFGLFHLINTSGNSLQGLLILLLIAAIPFISIYIFYKRVVLYPDRIEVYNFLNNLRAKIYLKDLRVIKYLNSTAGGNGLRTHQSYQSIILITSLREYSFNSIWFLNLRAFKAALDKHVDLNKTSQPNHIKNPH